MLCVCGEYKECSRRVSRVKKKHFVAALCPLESKEVRETSGRRYRVANHKGIRRNVYLQCGGLVL